MPARPFYDAVQWAGSASCVDGTCRRGFIWVPAALILGLGAWMLMSGYSSKTTAEVNRCAWRGPRHRVPSPATNIRQEGSPPNPATARAETTATLPSEAIAPVEPAPVDGLKISSQFWRRGLGSKALVTFTLRNGNGYPVKHIGLPAPLSAGTEAI